MLTGLQIRAARAALGWTADELARRSEVSLKTVQRYELADNVPAGRIAPLMAVKSALEAAGIEFIGTPEDRPAFAWRGRRNDRRRKNPE